MTGLRVVLGVVLGLAVSAAGWVLVVAVALLALHHPEAALVLAAITARTDRSNHP